MTVLFIGLAHGIPILISRAVFGRRGAYVAAAIMLVIAITTGASKFVGADILGIILALVVCR